MGRIYEIMRIAKKCQEVPRSAKKCANKCQKYQEVPGSSKICTELIWNEKTRNLSPLKAIPYISVSTAKWLPLELKMIEKQRIAENP